MLPGYQWLVALCDWRDRRGDRVREIGFSKERRLDPQITIGLLTYAVGFLLMVSAFVSSWRARRVEDTTNLTGTGHAQGLGMIAAGQEWG